MKRRFIQNGMKVASVLLALGASSVGAQTPHTHAPAGASVGDSASAARAITALFAAAERNDMAALDSIYAGEALTIIEGSGINRGWKDYRDHHLAPEMKEMTGFQYRPFEIEAHVHGTVAWAIFRYMLKAKAGEQNLDLVGRGTAILERRGNRWVVRHTQTSSRARRPTDPVLP